MKCSVHSQQTLEKAGQVFDILMSFIKLFQSCNYVSLVQNGTHIYTFERFFLTQDVDDNVVNIDFLKKDTQQLFGLAKNKKSRMRSDDGGFSWCAIPDVEYEMAMADVNQIIGVFSLFYKSSFPGPFALYHFDGV